MMVLGSEFSESDSNSQAPNNNLGGEDVGITSNNTFQERLGLQGGGSESGQNEDHFDPFGQGGDSPGSGDRGFDSGSENPDDLGPQNFGDDNNTSPASFESYTDPRYGFSVQYPAGWDPPFTDILKGTNERNVAGIFNTHNTEGNMYLFVGIDNRTEAKELSLEDYSEMYVNKLMDPNSDRFGLPVEIEAKLAHPVGNSEGYMVIYNQTLESPVPLGLDPKQRILMLVL